MPVRQIAADDKLRIWRNFQIGKLLDLTMLDTRQYERDLTDVSFLPDSIIAFATNFRMLGLLQHRMYVPSSIIYVPWLMSVHSLRRQLHRGLRE